MALQLVRWLTKLSVLWTIAATVFEFTKTAVPGQSVHDPCWTDSMNESRFSGGWMRENIQGLLPQPLIGEYITSIDK